MAIVIEKKRFRILLLRGMLGGALGGFFLVAALLFSQYGRFVSNYGVWLLVGYFMFGLPYGAFVGSVVGMTTWLIHRHTAWNLGFFGRSIVGTSIGMILFEVSSYLANTPEYVSGSSWQRHLIGILLFGALTGGVAGIIVGGQSAKSHTPR